MAAVYTHTLCCAVLSLANDGCIGAEAADGGVLLTRRKGLTQSLWPSEVRDLRGQADIASHTHTHTHTHILFRAITYTIAS